MTVNHDVEGSSPSVPAMAYISLGLEMIQRPMHYLFRLIVYLMKKRSSTLGELKIDECVSWHTEVAGSSLRLVY